MDHGMNPSPLRRPNRLTVAIAACVVAVGVAVVSSAGAGVSSHYDLTGHWRTRGTSLTLTQSGRVITWNGGPDNRAWIQTFKGTISNDPTYGPSFSGTFWQDEPGHLPPRYHGSMKAQIRDSCEFVFLSIVQAGQPTLSNIYFDKEPCTVTTTPALSRLNLLLFKKKYVVDSSQRGTCPSSFECVIREGAVVSICNRDDFRHQPFSLSKGNAFGGPAGKLVLRTGQCYRRRFVNGKAEAIQVRLYDAIHSQERFVVTVLPKKR
jgi:hypothetical protein